METRRRIVRNLNWNWAGTVSDIIVAFLLCPFLLNHLGELNYGAWVMIGSFTGYFGLLDFGVRGSVGRYIAFYREKQDAKSTNEIFVTASVLLAFTGFVGFMASMFAAFFADRFVGYEFSPSELRSLQLALVFAGLNLAFQLLFSVADGVLWGCQRFDRLNLVSIPFDIGRGVFSAVAVYFGGGIVSLSVVAMLLTLIAGIAKTFLAFQSEPALHWQVRHIDRERIREVYSFGIWSSIRSVTSMIPTRVSPLVIGSLLGVSAVAPLSIAARLISSAAALLVAATGVITPVATAIHAREDTSKEQQLMLVGGKYCLAFATLLMLLFVLLGHPLIVLWVGPSMESAYGLLVVLAAGRWISMSQVITRGVITAKAKHSALAITSLIQGILTILSGIVLARFFGVSGFVAAIALGDAICEGIFSLVYGCKLSGISIVRYVRQSVRYTLQTFTAPSVLLYLAIWWHPVTTWLELAGYGCTFTFLSLALAVWFDKDQMGAFLYRSKTAGGDQLPCVT